MGDQIATTMTTAHALVLPPDDGLFRLIREPYRKLAILKHTVQPSSITNESDAALSSGGALHCKPEDTSCTVYLSQGLFQHQSPQVNLQAAPKETQTRWEPSNARAW